MSSTQKVLEDIEKNLKSFEQDFKTMLRLTHIQPPIYPTRNHPAVIIRRDYTTKFGHLTVIIDPTFQTLELFANEGKPVGSPIIFDKKGNHLSNLLREQMTSNFPTINNETADYKLSLNDSPELYSGASLQDIKPSEVIYPGFCTFDWMPDDTLLTTASHKLSRIC